MIESRDNSILVEELRERHFQGFNPYDSREAGTRIRPTGYSLQLNPAILDKLYRLEDDVNKLKQLLYVGNNKVVEDAFNHYLTVKKLAEGE